jgi:HK97 family phage major capsid protein
MKIVHAIIAFIAGLFGSVPMPAASVSAPPPTNTATLFFERCLTSLKSDWDLALMSVNRYCRRQFGVSLPFALGLTAEEETKQVNKTLIESLESINKRLGRIDEIEKAIDKNAKDYEAVTKLVAEVQKELLDFRKQSLQLNALTQRAARPGFLSDGAAKWLGGVYLLAAKNQGKLDQVIIDGTKGKGRDELIEAKIREHLGLEEKASLTVSDIPVPTQWQGEVVELVSQFGAARKYGTVFPLGAGTVKLPKLGTDTAFGLISPSGGVTAKSPTVVFVTFTPEKYGGLVTLPSEIDEDSIIAMGQFLGRYCARQMAKAEDTLFFVGDGSTNGDPEGLILSCATDSKTVVMANTKNKRSDTTLANLRALRAVVDAAALGTSAYYMHPTFEQHLSGLNTAGDKPYVANGINGASLDGFPIRWVDVMPVYSVGDTSGLGFILFGDASYQYLGVRKGMEIKTSTEAGFTTDEILVRALQRFTIGKMATGAMGVLVAGADS